MKRKRLNIRVYNEDGTEAFRVNAAFIYDEIREAVMKSSQNYSQDRPTMPYPYENVMDFVAQSYGVTRKDLEQAYAKCRKVYNAAVTDFYINEYHQCWYALTQKAKKALYKEKEKSTHRRIILDEE